MKNNKGNEAYTEGFIAGKMQTLKEFENRFTGCYGMTKMDEMWIKNIELFIKEQRENVK